MKIQQTAISILFFFVANCGYTGIMETTKESSTDNKIHTKHNDEQIDEQKNELNDKFKREIYTAWCADLPYVSIVFS